MTKTRPEYRAQTAATTLRLIAEGADPWLALGHFLDGWRGTALSRRSDLIREPLPEVSPEALRWAALMAASVDFLCVEGALPPPALDEAVRIPAP